MSAANPLPASKVAAVKAKILADPHYLMGAILGFNLQWFHRLWIDWSLRHPFSMIEGPRGFGKSHCATVGMAVWHILRNLNGRFLIVSKTDEAAAAFVGMVREILETNAILIQCFGSFMGAATWTDGKIQVAQRTAAWGEATLEARGLGGQLARTHWNGIWLDDVHDLDRADSEAWSARDWIWFDKVLTPTLRPGGFIQARATPYAWDDFRGQLEDRAGEQNIYWAEDVRLGGPVPSAAWRVLKTQAILRDGSSLWEEEFPLHDRVDANGVIFKGLATLRAENPKSFEQQFQQICEKPKQGERGTVFNVSLFEVWTAETAPDPTRLRLFMRHDAAWTSREEAAKRSSKERQPDYTAITIAGVDLARRWFILDHWRGQVSDKDGVAKAREIALVWIPKGLKRYRVERTGLQLHQAPEFYKRIRAAMPIPVEFYNPQKNKVAHAEPFSLAIQQGRVLWNPAIFETYPDLLEYFDLFPSKGVPDDDVDSTSGAYNMGEVGTANVAGFVQQKTGGAAAVPETSVRATARGAGASMPSLRSGAAGFGSSIRATR